jgi:hypothetical protein
LTRIRQPDSGGWSLAVYLRRGPETLAFGIIMHNRKTIEDEDENDEGT